MVGRTLVSHEEQLSMAVLQILTSEGNRVAPLPSGPITIGRSRENDVVLEDSRCGRKHCSLAPAAGGYLLRDPGSRNGTRHNGQRVSEVFVRFGESFVIGKTVLRLFEHEAPSVELIELSETREEDAVAVPLAELINLEDDSLLERDAVAAPSPDVPMTAEQVMIRARQDLNNLRTAGNNPGFGIEQITLLDCHGKTMHAADGLKDPSEAVRTLRLLMYGAFRIRATDVHFNAARDGYQVRFRVDGKMLPLVLLPTQVARAVLSAVKILAELDIGRREAIQEGSFTVSVPRRVDCRVSFGPTSQGENLAMRILDAAVIPASLEALGLSPVMLRQMQMACNCDSGMIISSGPTGSGKTTTLYTAIRSIDCQSRNVITIEDPIEYHLPGITQMQTDDRKDLTFGNILKSVLRQDPDVILVGEMRDAETARTAIQAAMTGHLVFSTLHARDAIGSIFRLLDLQIERYMIANAVSICLAQRLIRVLCENCKKSFQPKPSQLVRMNMQNREIPHLYTHVGCKRCMEVGYWGRLAIFEMLSFNDNLRDAIIKSPTIAEIRSAAGEWTYQTLLDSGYKRVADGLTTLEEVESVAARE